MELYYYQATINRVIDGDTIVCDIDLGFKIEKKTVTCRFNNYNAPEIRSIEKYMGSKAKDHLCEFFDKHPTFVIRSLKSDAFGRWLVDIFYFDNGPKNLVEELVAAGWGVHWNGKGKRPKFDLREEYPLKT